MENPVSKSPLLGNRYQLQQSVGTGGMAIVYQAYDLMLERPVAIKVLKQNYSQDTSFRERFKQEAKSAANLSHPNIVTVHDFGLDNDKLYIVMEYVPGTDLKTMIKETKVFTIDEAIPLIVQACAGIGYAHRAGLVHCDIKPHNMLVTPEVKLKVTDFGIARALSSINPNEKYDIVWGSPQYFSPEQASGNPPSPASDVYSLGVILYEMLTGKLPFESTDPSILAKMHRDSKPTPARQLNPNIPEALDQIITKVLSKEPSARYRTADQLGRVLLAFSQLARPYEADIPFPTTDYIYNQPVKSYPVIPASQSHKIRSAAKKIRQDAMDFGTIGIALLAILAVAGLIPFWLYIWFLLQS